MRLISWTLQSGSEQDPFSSRTTMANRLPAVFPAGNQLFYLKRQTGPPLLTNSGKCPTATLVWIGLVAKKTSRLLF
jgi:hypothetical protein